MVQLLQDGRWLDGLGYAGASLVGSVALLGFGLWLARI
jgi:fluoride ion exporter CrcB/FEX